MDAETGHTTDDETIDVPVVRAARVALVGRAVAVRPGGFTLQNATTMLGPRCRIVARAKHDRGYPFRPGIMTIRRAEDDLVAGNTWEITAFCSGDYVYLVEDV